MSSNRKSDIEYIIAVNLPVNKHPHGFPTMRMFHYCADVPFCSFISSSLFLFQTELLLDVLWNGILVYEDVHCLVADEWL